MQFRWKFFSIKPKEWYGLDIAHSPEPERRLSPRERFLGLAGSLWQNAHYGKVQLVELTTLPVGYLVDIESAPRVVNVPYQ